MVSALAGIIGASLASRGERSTETGQQQRAGPWLWNRVGRSRAAVRYRDAADVGANSCAVRAGCDERIAARVQHGGTQDPVFEGVRGVRSRAEYAGGSCQDQAR